MKGLVPGLLPPLEMFRLAFYALFIWNAGLAWSESADRARSPRSTRALFVINGLALAAIVFVTHRIGEEIDVYDRLDALDGAGMKYPDGWFQTSPSSNSCWAARPFVGTWTIVIAGGNRKLQLKLRRSLQMEVWEADELVAEGSFWVSRRGDRRNH